MAETSQQLKFQFKINKISYFLYSDVLLKENMQGKKLFLCPICIIIIIIILFVHLSFLHYIIAHLFVVLLPLVHLLFHIVSLHYFLICCFSVNITLFIRSVLRYFCICQLFVARLFTHEQHYIPRVKVMSLLSNALSR